MEIFETSLSAQMKIKAKVWTAAFDKYINRSFVYDTHIKSGKKAKDKFLFEL
jgi:hypothetical protein